MRSAHRIDSITPRPARHSVRLSQAPLPSNAECYVSRGGVTVNSAPFWPRVRDLDSVLMRDRDRTRVVLRTDVEMIPGMSPHAFARASVAGPSQPSPRIQPLRARCSHPLKSMGKPAHCEHVRGSKGSQSGFADWAIRTPRKRDDSCRGAETGACALRAGANDLVAGPSTLFRYLGSALPVSAAAAGPSLASVASRRASVWHSGGARRTGAGRTCRENAHCQGADEGVPARCRGSKALRQWRNRILARNRLCEGLAAVAVGGTGG